MKTLKLLVLGYSFVFSHNEIFACDAVMGAQTYCIINEAMPSNMVAMDYIS